MIEIFLITTDGEVHKAIAAGPEGAAQAALSFTRHPRYKRITVVYP